MADGMGGQGHGQQASRLAVQSLVEYVAGSLRSKQVMPQTLLPVLKAGIEYANRIVYQRNLEQSTAMGTTMTACLVVDSTAYVGHVGDSRCYLYRDPGGLSQMTQDHSLVAALAAAGVIQPEDIYTHPRRNLIYRCLGEKASVEKPFPRSGVPEVFSSANDFDAYVQALVKTGCIDNGKKIWWDIRPHPFFSTIEFRICDMPATFDDTIAIAALCQALVARLAWLYRKGLRTPTLSSHYIEENKWRVMHYGLDADVIDFVH